MSKLYSGAEIVFKCMEDQDVEFIFGYPGGAVLPIYDELKNHKKIKHILVRHEQGAGHAAEGYARSSGKPGVILVTSGPGATNAVTALTDAYMDSIPLVCITGQVPTHLIGTDAFQECDTTGITRPCTKHNWLVKDIKKLSSIMHKAFEVATTGRPGPVLVDIPKDIQFAKGKYIKPKELKSNKHLNIKFNGQDKDIEAAVELIKKSSKPILYTGGGVINSGPKATEMLRNAIDSLFSRDVVKANQVCQADDEVDADVGEGHSLGKESDGAEAGDAGALRLLAQVGLRVVREADGAELRPRAHSPRRRGDGCDAGAPRSRRRARRRCRCPTCRRRTRRPSC